MDYLAILQTVVKYGPLIKEVVDEALTNESIVTKVTHLSAPFASVLEKVGAQFFPKVASEFHIAAAVMSAFDPNVTKWVQGSINQFVTPSPNLKVDGVYGPATKTAVEQLQTQLGLTADGWAGQMTQGAISKLLAEVKKVV